VPLVLATLASGALGAFLAVRPLRSDLATRPPVVILDAAEALRGVPAGQVGPVIARQRDIARRLAAGGVLVLDPQAVVAAPAGLSCQKPGNETKTVSSSDRARRTGGPRRPTDSADRLAAVLEFGSTRTRRD